MAAIGALAALRERGLTVPEDVSLAGFDDIPLIRDITPALTTVRVPMLELGRQAMRLALDTSDAGERVVVPGLNNQLAATLAHVAPRPLTNAIASWLFGPR